MWTYCTGKLWLQHCCVCTFVCSLVSFTIKRRARCSFKLLGGFVKLELIHDDWLTRKLQQHTTARHIVVSTFQQSLSPFLAILFWTLIDFNSVTEFYIRLDIWHRSVQCKKLYWLQILNQLILGQITHARQEAMSNLKFVAVQWRTVIYPLRSQNWHVCWVGMMHLHSRIMKHFYTSSWHISGRLCSCAIEESSLYYISCHLVSDLKVWWRCKAAMYTMYM